MQESSKNQTLALKKNSTSLWKETAKVSKEMGYKNFQSLSKQDKADIIERIKQQYPDETWAKKKKSPKKKKLASRQSMIQS